MDSKAQADFIAKELEEIVAGIRFFCPKCGAEHTLQPNEYDAEDGPRCGKCDLEMEQTTLMDFLDDGWYNDEIVTSTSDPSHVKRGAIMVAWGGPEIWVDSGDEKVRVYWWGNNAEADISPQVADGIRDILQDVWDCKRCERWDSSRAPSAGTN